MKRISLLFLLFTCAFAFAQETRSTLTGRVTDETGAVIPHANVVVTNTDTGAKNAISTNSAGQYTVPFLAPGPYKIEVKAKGFKTYVATGITLQTQQTGTKNISLAIGTSEQTVTVSSDVPLVDTQNASTGQVLTAAEVEDLPSNGRSPLGFAHTEYGAVSKGKHSSSQTRPFDNTTADDFSLGGGNSSSNELLLNGVPNMESSQRTAGFSPELDSVDAVAVDEFDSSAANGDTSGGTVNITTKSGTNDYHGTLSEYYEGTSIAAKPYFTPAGKSVPSTHYNQFGATIGGPVRIPHVFNGRNKLFFFYAFEGYIGAQPATSISSVPTAAERAGDFSALLGISSANQLYNPYTATLNSKQQVVRQAIPNNCLVTTCNGLPGAGLTINPIAAAYLALVPAPNYNGASTKPDGENNFFADDPSTNNYKSNMGRIDWNITNSNKIFFEAHRSKYVTSQGNIFNNLLTGSNSQTILWGGSVDDVQNFSPTLNLENRLGFSRWSSLGAPNGNGVNPTNLGLPGYIAANSTAFAVTPMSFSDSSGISALGGSPGNFEAFDTIQYFASLNKTWGKHNFKIGPDIRSNKDTKLNPGAADGSFSFSSGSGDFVTAGTGAARQAFGGAFALFALGLPTGGSYQVSTRFQYDNWYSGFFLQDDWKALHNLTISMGLRLEHETPVVEGHNNMVVGWNPGTVNAVTAPAAAAYAANPNSNLPVSSFSATGGVIYATPSHRSAYSTAMAYISPRLGFAYSPDFSHGTLAIRGGFGIYDNPFNDYYQGQQYGFSQATSMITSINNGLSPATNLSDPFPTANNPIQQPFGSSLGINTNLGSNIVFYAPVKVAYAEKWDLDVQKQLGRTWLFEAGYLGVHQVHQSYSNDVSALPLQYLSRSPEFDPVVTAQLGASTTNPFYGIIPGPTSGLNNSKTISVASLLHPYPEYSGVTEQLIPGASSNFNAIMVKVSKRMSHGLLFNFNYEHSRQLGASSQLNPGGPLWYGETGSDFPDHVSFTGIYQLPFGKGQPFLNHSRILDELIGGYTVTSIYQFLSGTPLGWGNVIYTGNYSGFSNNPHDTHGASFNTAGFNTDSKVQPNGYNFRTFPENLLRSDPTKDFDFSVLKNFTIFERLIIQPRVDAFNAFNRAQFQGANTSPTSSAFGYVNKQLNSSRQLQGGIHILF